MEEMEVETLEDMEVETLPLRDRVTNTSLSSERGLYGVATGVCLFVCVLVGPGRDELVELLEEGVQGLNNLFLTSNNSDSSESQSRQPRDVQLKNKEVLARYIK